MHSHPSLLDRIIVPLDGSAVAEMILPDVRRILRLAGSEIILIRSEFPVLADVYPSVVHDTALEDAKTYLQNVADRLSEEGVRTRTIVDFGPAAEFVLRIARQERATLIALATHGRTGATRALMGSVAEQIIRKSAVPVVAFRSLPAGPAESFPTGERRQVRNILLPLDRSERAIRALDPAADLCRLFGARLILLHILESDEDSTSAQAFLQAVEARADSQGIVVTSLVERGNVVDEILDVARFHDADLIAMATHGRRGLSRLVTGSVTEGVLRKAFIPVLVLRTVEAAATGGRESVA
jgi:nucleotide-binding universal stress UspA family protein